MAHIFISYSHDDAEYAHRLADTLQAEGFNVWIDARIDYGSQWPHEIQKQLDACDAFILIMTPRSFVSEWVQSELQRAKRKLKPIFPLLLEGDEPWLSVESTQYYDVRGEILPDPKFYSAIGRMTSRPEGQAVQLPVNGGKKPLKPKPSSESPKMRTELVIALIGAIATLLAALIPIIWSYLSNPSPPSSAATEISTSETSTSAPRPTSTMIDTPIPSEPSQEPQALPEAQMVLVPAGPFIMGSDNGRSDHQPAHNVDLKSYYIDTYEVTNADYLTCVQTTLCKPPLEYSSLLHPDYFNNPQYADYPVIHVTWDMAQTYCEWREARLPTEAEWEKAARGTDGRTYPWGEGIDCSKANYHEAGDCVGDTTQVGIYEDGKSPFGAYDMAGNVYEWIADWYGENYYSTLGENAADPTGPESGEYRVLRGGSFGPGSGAPPDAIHRWGFGPAANMDFVGFRCAKDANP